MTPDEVLKKIESMGIKTSRSTLLRFEKAGVIPTPKRGALGRGQGRYTDYANDTPKHFFASWWTVKSEGVTLKELSKLLPLGRRIEKTFMQSPGKKAIKENFENTEKEMYSVFDNDIVALKALMKYENGDIDFNPGDLFRAEEKLANCLDEQVKPTNQSVISDDDYDYMCALLDIVDDDLDDKRKTNIRACKIYLKWDSYYDTANSDISEMMQSQEKSLELDQKIIEYLKAENDRLKAELEQLKKHEAG